MATYSLTLTGAFTTEFGYPWSKAVSVTNAYDPIKRVRTLVSASEDLLFTRDNITGAVAMIYNRSNSEHARIRVSETGGDTLYIDIPPGQFFAIPSVDFEVNRAESAFSAYNQWDTIHGQGVSGDCEVELLVIGYTTTAS